MSLIDDQQTDLVVVAATSEDPMDEITIGKALWRHENSIDAIIVDFLQSNRHAVLQLPTACIYVHVIRYTAVTN